MVRKATHHSAGISPSLLVTGVKSFIRIFQAGGQSVRGGEGNIGDYPFSHGVLLVRESSDTRLTCYHERTGTSGSICNYAQLLQAIATFSEHRENFQRCVRHFVNAAVEFSFGNHP